MKSIAPVLGSLRRVCLSLRSHSPSAFSTWIVGVQEGFSEVLSSSRSGRLSSSFHADSGPAVSDHGRVSEA